MSCRVGAWFRRVRQAVFIAKNGCNGCNGRCNGRVPASQILLLFTDPQVLLWTNPPPFPTALCCSVAVADDDP